MTTQRTRHEQNIEQVAGIIAAQIDLSPDFNLVHARRINETSGWTFEVRYDDNDYFDTNSYTLVEWMPLSDAALSQAFSLAESWRQAEIENRLAAQYLDYREERNISMRLGRPFHY